MNAKRVEELEGLKGGQLFQIGDTVYAASITAVSPSKEYVCLDITSGPTPCENWFRAGQVDVAELLNPPAVPETASDKAHASDPHKTHAEQTKKKE